MRYKSKGGPQGLDAYMKTNNIDRHLLMRYVGNRFHILFELAGNIYYIHKQLTDYLRIYCSKTEHYRLCIRKDLNTDIVLKELAVCGLFGKVLTGPWMTCIYRKSDLTNLDSAKPLTYLVDKLKTLVDTPSLLWNNDLCCLDIAPDSKTELSRTVHSALCDSPMDQTTLDLLYHIEKLNSSTPRAPS